MMTTAPARAMPTAVDRTWPRTRCQRSGWIALATSDGSMLLPGGRAFSRSRMASSMGEVMARELEEKPDQGQIPRCLSRPRDVSGDGRDRGLFLFDGGLQGFEQPRGLDRLGHVAIHAGGQILG